MLKKIITYVDYNDVERTETFYFNLTEAEIAEMELSTNGGYAEMLDNIVAAKDAPSLVKIWKGLILKAYGVKSPDGKRFIKSEELSTEFSQTPAYSKLFMEFTTDTDAAIEFVKGIIPASLNDKN